MNKIIIKSSPLLEVSFDNTHIHIVDFENELNNEVFYYNEIINIEFIKKTIKIETAKKKIGIEIDQKNISIAENIVAELKRLRLSKEILYPKKKYNQESFKSFTARYNGFGKNLYKKLKNENSIIFEKLKFYQMLNEKEDSYAEYIHNGNSFVIQLDFHSELILISNNEKHIEIGTWEKNEIKLAINFILEELIK
ncbi:hypothetical protein [uncultured Polaribacter sp.]|uniref:hypothetical protein n=1 Tax=uncultured Polaribacter sp. TaxID=174711 RepID=UPI002620D1A9|nr:hypothetical protein [uncultured Polaribacter sp.]